MQGENEDVKKKFCFIGSKYRSAMRVFFRISWTFRLFKTRPVHCLKHMRRIYPVTGRHVSEEKLPHLSRLRGGQVIVNFTFS